MLIGRNSKVKNEEIESFIYPLHIHLIKKLFLDQGVASCAHIYFKNILSRLGGLNPPHSFSSAFTTISNASFFFAFFHILSPFILITPYFFSIQNFAPKLFRLLLKSLIFSAFGAKPLLVDFLPNRILRQNK